MKKLFALPLVAAFVLHTAFAQELTVSGELKTGFYWEQKQEGNKAVEETGSVHNKNDAGEKEGRFRLNMQLDKENVGMKVRFQQEVWTTNTPSWVFAFAYGYFLDDQIKVSGGRLGDSPWGAGGPERWDELDTRIGVRTEIMPKIVPGLNAGFVLNQFNEGTGLANKNETIGELLKETVLGVSYTHEWFALRLACRLDSELDTDANRNDEGAQMLYRIEENILTNYLDGMKIWANGFYKGLHAPNAGSDGKAPLIYLNWLYFQLAPDAFTAQLRLGLDAAEADRQVLRVRPSFYYNFFDRLLTAGLAFYYCQDFGTKISNGSPYQYWRIEPQIKLNLPNTTIALVYQYTDEYISQDYLKHTHWINLQVAYTF